MKGFFNQMFDYNFYCNKKIIEQCIAMETIPDKTIRLFSHILNAHHIWNSRIINIPSKYTIWQLHDIKEWEDIHYENQRNSFEITSNADDFEDRIDYESSEGRLFTNTLQDMLFHIINHSTQHRGQIAKDFRKKGLDPLILDYAIYKR
ncbi:putative damage-inducible protein DinB [Maribacter vaceletii]|uniref:Putative damage-inducible protein DinB n=1 Tax=Maribacter vaceletii TaxID=1206816 RepID=A0A495ECL8_9FLAO|nr:DinB family protein [Maribacter vaceletii]RKR14620.1 putative damage-inducible protein DinB [Maribacter vaceletii]